MIKRLTKGITQPKARTFLLFLVLALAAWLISRLSETYSHTVAFELAYGQAPDSLILMQEPPQEMDVRVRASGFKLLGYQLSPRTIGIDLSAAQRVSGRYLIDPGGLRRQVEQQLGSGIALLEMPRDTVFLQFQHVRSRTVPVRVVLDVELAQNYMMAGEWTVDPPQIHLLGPPAEIDTIAELRTRPMVLRDVRDTLRLSLELEAYGRLPHTEFSKNAVQLTAPVFRFSETVIDVPVHVVNIPENMDIRTFPATIGILCRGTVELLNAIGPEGFRVEADYAAPDPQTGRLPLQLVQQPPGIHNSSLLENSVEFIVRRE